MLRGALEAAMQAPSNSSSQLSWSAWTLARMISCMTRFIRSVCPSACGVYAGVNFKAVLCRAHSLRQPLAGVLAECPPQPGGSLPRSSTAGTSAHA
jgi:hypothetical protein